MFDGNPGEIDFGSSWREVRVSEGSSYGESTVIWLYIYNFLPCGGLGIGKHLFENVTKELLLRKHLKQYITLDNNYREGRDYSFMQQDDFQGNRLLHRI